MITERVSDLNSTSPVAEYLEDFLTHLSFQVLQDESSPLRKFFPLHICLIPLSSKNVVVFKTSVSSSLRLLLTKTGCYIHRKQDFLTFASIEMYAKSAHSILKQI